MGKSLVCCYPLVFCALCHYANICISMFLVSLFSNGKRALSGYSQLIVNGKIVVRKDNATGKLDVEGEYYFIDCLFVLPCTHPKD